MRPPRATPEGLSRTFHCPVAILSRKIPLPHQNPADRFIAATAIYYELNLATVDAQLKGYLWLQILS
ncbi:MAG: hypothetical protein ACRCU2_29485 [Planktothrix sp.]